MSRATGSKLHQVAQDKGSLYGRASPALPASIQTDEKRLQQISKLLSNASSLPRRARFRYTSGGGEEQPLLHEGRSRDAVLPFGERHRIGITPTSRKLSSRHPAGRWNDQPQVWRHGTRSLDSREIARLLVAKSLVSTPGEGSTFTLYMREPISSAYVSPAQGTSRGMRWPPSPLHFDAIEVSEAFNVNDDRNAIEAGERILLIVEDDAGFAQILLDLAHEKGFKGLVAARGDMALALARKFRPDAVTLDLKLPDRDGWTVLDRLKHDPATSHIPVHIISSGEEQRQRAIKMGAFTQLQKPISREDLASAFDDIAAFVQRGVKRLLVVEDDDVQRMSIVELIGNGDVVTTAVASGEEALAALGSEQFDCMVVDLKLPDMTGFELIERIQKELGQNELPIIVYTGKELTEKEETQLRKVADAIIVKEASSPERPLAETALFLHRVEANLPEPKRRMLEQMPS